MQTQELENEIAETRQMLVERHAKETSDVKKASEEIKVRITRSFEDV